MRIDIAKLIELRDLASLSFKKKHIIVLNPEGKQENQEDVNANIIYDASEWIMPEELQTLVGELSQNSQASNEDKILAIYDALCRGNVYDDNLISYLRKNDDDSFDLPDWYGRDIDEKWRKNREQHNRRVCYEVSRDLAKALMELFKDNDDFNICIFWDKPLTHYFVGLSCSEYSITLDSDDFNDIKDLTRVKAGLTVEGIRILADNDGKFKSALDKFNKGRTKDSIRQIKNEIANGATISEQNVEYQNPSQGEDEPDSIVFLKNALEILVEKYGIDSQGIYEYMKEIVDITIGQESRKKIWKEIKGNNNQATRYIRCLVLDVEGQKYLIDVDSGVLRLFQKDELTRKDTEYIPYKELQRNWREPYDGS